MFIPLQLRKSEKTNTSPRHMPVHGNAHPIEIDKFYIFRDVISLLARVYIFLIDRPTQEVPMKKYLKEIVGPVFEIYVIELLGSMSTDEAWRHLRTLHFIRVYWHTEEYACKRL